MAKEPTRGIRAEVTQQIQFMGWQIKFLFAIAAGAIAIIGTIVGGLPSPQ